MSDRVGFFAGLADTLTAMCVYYLAGGILILGDGWGVHLFWLLLCAAACSLVFAVLLKKPRSTPVLTAVTAGLFLAVMAVLLLASETPLRFGYVLVLAVGGGMAAGVSLHACLHRPPVMRHLTHLDVLILVLLAVLLVREALAIDGATVALMTAVLLIDAAGAVGLRMSDGDSGSLEGRSAFRASMVALASAAGVALLIGLLTLLFSRSGALTDGVLRGIGGFFASLGGVLERFFRRLAALLHREERFEAIELEELPSTAGLEGTSGGTELSLNITALGIALAVLAIAAAAAVTLLLRKKRFSRGTKTVPAASDTGIRRTSVSGGLWRRLRADLAFRWRAFVRRDTPAGLLVRLERMGKRAHAPRQTGETMRAFIARMDASGGLDELSDALDREYYGGGKRTLSARRCRELRRYMRKAVQHG